MKLENIIIIIAMAVTMHISAKELDIADRNVERLLKKVGGVSKKDFNKAAKPYIMAVRLAAPKADKEVKRYDTPKLTGKIRAPKGSGVVVARYAPGNAGRSFQSLRLRRVKNAVVVGPKRAKGLAARGTFSGRRVDGYYVGMLDKKRPFVGAAWRVARPAVLSNIRKVYQRKIKEARAN